MINQSGKKNAVEYSDTKLSSNLSVLFFVSEKSVIFDRCEL